MLASDHFVELAEALPERSDRWRERCSAPVQRPLAQSAGTEDTMKSLVGTNIVLFALALTAACAAGSKSSKPDRVSGVWSGTIDRDGWERHFSLNIANANGSYGGSWMSMESQPGMTIDTVAVEGDDVRFQLNNLAFAGHVNGRKLSGSVTDARSGAPSGEFTLTRIDPQPEVNPLRGSR
jgi:hypothetical protein